MIGSPGMKIVDSTVYCIAGNSFLCAFVDLLLRTSAWRRLWDFFFEVILDYVRHSQTWYILCKGWVWLCLIIDTTAPPMRLSTIHMPFSIDVNTVYSGYNDSGYNDFQDIRHIFWSRQFSYLCHASSALGNARNPKILYKHCLRQRILRLQFSMSYNGTYRK